ncbi:MAG: FtsX-like permease family protein [Oscillospiraceae bacterium]|nr:FtsX-like permease family protein [Oscillospiraceae bacterium]
MKKSMMAKNLTQSILRSMGRYLAIVLIIALGSSMFVGLRMTKTDMVETGQVFTDDQNMFDLRLISSYGWTEDQVEGAKELYSVVDAEGVIYQDVIVRLGEEEDDSVFRFYAIPERINRIDLRGGRMPQAANECLADGFYFDDSVLGTQVTVSDANSEATADAMTYSTYTVVGYVSTPLYMDLNRGSTTVGNGSLTSYFYIPAEGFDVDYYTEINVTIEGDYEIYSDEYNEMLDMLTSVLEPGVQDLADERIENIVADAEEEYREGYEQYQDGLEAFEEGKEEAQEALDDAYEQLKDAEAEIAENEQLIADGQQQIDSAKNTLAASQAELNKGKAELEAAKSDAYAQLDSAQAELDKNAAEVGSGLTQINDGLKQIDDGLAQVNSGIEQLEAALPMLSMDFSAVQGMLDSLIPMVESAQAALELAKQLPVRDDATIAWLEADLAAKKTQLADYRAKLQAVQEMKETYTAQLEELYATKAQLEAQREELLATKAQLEEAKTQIDAGYAELEAGRATADAEFAAAEAEIAAGEKQLQGAKYMLSAKEAELANGKQQLADGKQQLEDGWAEYEEGKREAEKSIADGEKELADVAQSLAEARLALDDMEGSAQVYILDRNTNVGYASLDSNSDIVAGVSRVLPVFFLLIAALVCITTMTRMVNEERTQIGTLKALGYSNAAIISKYLIYAGSGAVVGCGLGVILGSIIFPKILWEAYCIMLYIKPDVEITFDWVLCIVVVATYTIVMLLTTWYCCRKALQEEPAELIRPKAPTSGKKIILEYLPFWDKFSFLNKVALRNIFRYRQRLLMMLIGIGGCTALLLTGFGLRDSIVNIVGYQFEEVTVYDLQVYFSEGQDEASRADFLEAVDGKVEDVMFYHQQSVELDYHDQVREISMIVGNDEIYDFIDLHTGEMLLRMPRTDEALLSVGVAEAMGVRVGDQVILRNADMQTLEVTVSGIYDNNVSNFAIVRPETLEKQWGEAPQQQMAFVKVGEEQDLYAASTVITGLDSVMNVTISQDTATMVGSMMDALDLLVVTIVLCAAMLAVIVLYNLINININERIREIATIKVLGFHAGETASYVFKENMILCVMGSLFGLLLGKLLLEFVMSQIKIDMVWFQSRITVLSLIISVVLTLVSAVIVQFIFYFKLEKVNMAESLKSVE